MTKYFVRIQILHWHIFNNFCRMHNVSANYVSRGFGVAHGNTMMYSVQMTHEDAVALKLSMDINIMETYA